MKKLGLLVLFLSIIISGYSQRLSSDTTFYSPGMIRTITYRIDNKKDRIQWYKEDGSAYQETKFLTNPKTEEVSYVEEGKLKSKYFKIKGKKNGIIENYYDSGKIKLKGYYQNDNADSIWTDFMENGNRIRVSYFKKGKRTQDTTFYSDGKIKMLSIFKPGNVETKIQFYKNGQVKYKGDYVDSKMSGQRTIYDENGQPINGDFIIYDEEGKKEREGKSINGKPEGEMKVYNSDGKEILIANFKNGFAEGYTYYYGIDGKPTLRQYYLNGEFVKKGPQ